LEADQTREKFGSIKAPQITVQEAKKLKQEILQQEVLIRGYQVHFETKGILIFTLNFINFGGARFNLFF